MKHLHENGGAFLWGCPVRTDGLTAMAFFLIDHPFTTMDCRNTCSNDNGGVKATPHFDNKSGV